jgi:hypothetical protein
MLTLGNGARSFSLRCDVPCGKEPVNISTKYF